MVQIKIYIIIRVEASWLIYPLLYITQINATQVELTCVRCSYIIERGVCFLVLAESSFSKRLAFAYLEDLQGEFNSQYGPRVDKVSRPYSFIEFGMCIMRCITRYLY